MDRVTRIVAIGSSNGDDQAAWLVADKLKERAETQIEIFFLNEPSQILDHIENCGRLIVIDACKGSGLPGTVKRLEWPDARISQHRRPLTHGMNVAESLQLAENLGSSPQKTILFAIEASDCEPGSTPSVHILDAMSELEKLIFDEITAS